MKNDIYIEEYYRISAEAKTKREKIKKNKKRETERTQENNKTLMFQTASFFLTLAVIFTGILFSGNAGKPEKTSESVKKSDYISVLERDILTPAPAAAVLYDAEIAGEAPVLAEMYAENISTPRIYKKNNLKYIDQHKTGMPNGCEIVSLAMALSRYLPEINAREIAEKYLPRAEYPAYNQGIYVAEDPTDYYIGDPAGKGLGIFAPGIAETAKNLLAAYELNIDVYNISGCTDDELFLNIYEGNPVIVWIPMRLAQVSWGTSITWHLPNSRLFRWPSPMHCAVLVDYTDTRVTLYDPTAGVVNYDRELFLQRWDEIGPYPDDTRHAVVIK